MSDTIQSTAAISQSQPTVDEIIDSLGEDVSVSWDVTYKGYTLYIRPIGGGFPLVKGESERFTEALRKAYAEWEAR